MKKINNKNWYGEIPNDWKVDRIGSVFKLRNTKVSDYDYKPLSVTMNGVVPQLESAAKTNAHDDRKLVRVGDFAINSRSDRRGSCGISNYEGSVSLINTVVTPMENINSKYYDYLFHSTSFADEFYKWGHGIVDDLWTTGWSEMKNIRIPIPPIKIQDKIAKFLSLKCGVIDEIIENTNTEIEKIRKLKESLITKAVTKGLNKNASMKDSGVEWIGKIPENWDLMRIKHNCWLKGRIGWDGLTSSEYCEEGPFLITGTDFDEGIINWDTCVHISKERFDEDVLLHIKENDLLITKDGTIGKVAVAKNCPSNVSLNSGVMLIRNIGKYIINSRYLYYVLVSNEFIKWYDLSQNGNSTIKHLYQEQFYNFKYTYPPINEQKAIVCYLDAECKRIDIIIKKKQEQISKLFEYKKSLIYEYVTGKKSV